MTPSFLDHVVLEVADVDRSLAFYMGVLGLSGVRVEEFHAGTAPFASVRVGDSLVDLFPASTPEPGPPHFCLTFEDPIEHIAAALSAHHIVTDPPQDRFGARGMGWSVYVHDPDGHLVELRSYTRQSP